MHASRFIMHALAGMAMGGTAMAEQAAIPLKVEFATAQPGPFAAACPTVPSGARIWVRASWDGFTRPDDIKDPYLVRYWSAGDFANALEGRQQLEGKAVFAGRPDPYYISRDRTSVTCEINTGARDDGTLGTRNRWDRGRGAFIDGPLPGCDGLAPGPHEFTASVYYYAQGRPDSGGRGQAAFTIRTEGPPPVGRVAPPRAASLVRPPPRPQPISPQAIILEPQDLHGFEGQASAATNGDLVLLREPQDAFWTVPANIRGAFYPRFEIQSGTTLGEEFLTPDPPLLHEGLPVCFASATAVQPAGEGRFVCELRADQPLVLAPGDELRVPRFIGRRAQAIGRLILEPAAPPPALLPLHVCAKNPDLFDQVRCTLAWDQPVNNTHTNSVRVTVRNMCGHSQTYGVRSRVLDYFQVPLTDDVRRLTLDAHAAQVVALRFPPTETDRYRCVVEVTDPTGAVVHVEREMLVDQLQGPRAKAWLNAGWEVALMPGVTLDAQPPQQANWRKTSLPSSPGREAKEHVAWWKTRFFAPEALHGERVMLRFDRVSYEATVLLNGTKLGVHLGPDAPFEFDVGPLLRWGQTNDLCVGTRNGVAVLGAADLKKQPVTLGADSDVEGPGASQAMLFWEVTLCREPQARLADVFAKPSYRRKRLDVGVHAEGLAPGSYTLAAHVEFVGKTVLTLPDFSAASASGTLDSVLGADWGEPVLWGPGQPNLLCLVTELRDAAGKVLDRSRVRFGFRELWADGRNLVFNGVPMKFRGFAMEDTAAVEAMMQRDNTRSRLLRDLELGGQFQRHSYGVIGPEVADEIGLLVAQGVAGISHPTLQKIESDRFWQNAARDSAGIVHALRNHPSICEWYLSNEFAECAPRADLAVKRLQALADSMQAADGTRLEHAGCDLDLRGHMPTCSTHYPVDLRSFRASDSCLPESRLWRLASQQFHEGDMVPMGLAKGVANVGRPSPITWGRKPILINENGWLLFLAPPEGLAEISGESVYAGPGGVLQAFYEALRLTAEGHRDAEASLITPWSHIEQWSIRDALPACDVVPVMPNTTWVAGSTVRYDLNVHHDVPRSERCRLAWGIWSGGAWEQQGERTFALGPAALERTQVAFHLPQVKDASLVELRFRLLGAAGAVLAEKAMPGRVWPRTALQAPPGARVGLFDPAGKTSAALEAAGLTIARVLPTAANLAPLQVLVIGEDLGDHPALSEHGVDVLAFLQRGGTVILLHQSRPPSTTWLPAGLQPATGVVRSRGFLRAPHAPILAGLTERDLMWWLPDARVSVAPYVKPSRGNVRTLIDVSDGVSGFNYSALLELREGRGRVLACQLTLLDRLDASPVSRLLLQRLLEDAVRTPAPLKRAALLAGADSALEQKLADLGADVERVASTAKLSGYATVLVDAGAALAAADQDALAAFVQTGGVVVLHGLGAAQTAAMQHWFGAGVAGHPPQVPAWTGRALPIGRDPWLEGLSAQDFFWRRKAEGEDMAAYFYNDTFLIERLFDYAWDVPSGTPLLYPGAWVRVNQGAGVWLVDNVRWDAAGRALSAKTDRIGSELLSNLGVALKGRTARRFVSDLDYRVVDLSCVLNRPLHDEQAEDGAGGWTDQGPGKDLRAFIPGHHVFHGVPFDIPPDKSCLVMASSFRKVVNPMQVTIPVGAKAKALHVLQTSAWTSALQHGSYQIVYADGTTAEIALTGGENLRDWQANDLQTAQAPFLNEHETLTQWAWSGSSPEVPVVSLFLLQWINPHPDKVIQSVVVQSRKQGILILLGLTLGLERVAGNAPAAAAPLVLDAPMDARYQEGVRLLDLGRHAEAAQQFAAVLAAAPGHVPSRLRLAQAQLRSGRETAAEALLRETIDQHPNTLEAYLVLGRYDEEHGRWKEAQEIYRRSLAVEANQPPVVEALARVGRKIAP